MGLQMSLPNAGRDCRLRAAGLGPRAGLGGRGGITKTDGSGVTWSLAFREQKVRPGQAAASQEGPGALCSPGLQKEGSSQPSAEAPPYVGGPGTV